MMRSSSNSVPSATKSNRTWIEEWVQTNQGPLRDGDFSEMAELDGVLRAMLPADRERAGRNPAEITRFEPARERLPIR